MEFIGRKRELDVLEKFWNKEGYDLGVVYGRRRIGKSFLLKHFSEGKDLSYYKRLPMKRVI